MNLKHRMLEMAHGGATQATKIIDRLRKKEVASITKDELIELTINAMEFLRCAGIVKYESMHADDCCEFNIDALDKTALEYMTLVGEALHYRYHLMDLQMDDAS